MPNLNASNNIATFFRLSLFIRTFVRSNIEATANEVRSSLSDTISTSPYCILYEKHLVR